MRIAVITNFNQYYEDTGRLSSSLWSQYCSKHGYDFIASMQDWNYCDGYRKIDSKAKCQNNRPFAWSKIKMIEFFVRSNLYDYVIWVDADTLPTNWNIKFENFCEVLSKGNKIFGFTKTHQIETGVMIFDALNVDVIKFLYQVYSQPNNIIYDGAWEQKGVQEVLEEKKWNDIAYYFSPKELNAHVDMGIWEHGDFIAHIGVGLDQTGKRKSEKMLGFIPFIIGTEPSNYKRLIDIFWEKVISKVQLEKTQVRGDLILVREALDESALSSIEHINKELGTSFKVERQNS